MDFTLDLVSSLLTRKGIRRILRVLPNSLVKEFLHINFTPSPAAVTGFVQSNARSWPVISLPYPFQLHHLYFDSRVARTEGDGEIEDETSAEHLDKELATVRPHRRNSSNSTIKALLVSQSNTYSGDWFDGHCEGCEINVG